MGRKKYLLRYWLYSCSALRKVQENPKVKKQGKSKGFYSCDWPSNLILDSNRRFFSPCDLEIWWMTSKNNRTLLLYLRHFKSICEFKLELQSRNAQLGSKFELAIFCPVWPSNLMDDLGKQQGTSSILHQALCIISNPSVKSNWGYRPETLNTGHNWWFFCPARPWNLMDDLEKQ